MSPKRFRNLSTAKRHSQSFLGDTVLGCLLKLRDPSNPHGHILKGPKNCDTQPLLDVVFINMSIERCCDIMEIFGATQVIFVWNGEVAGFLEDICACICNCGGCTHNWLDFSSMSRCISHWRRGGFPAVPGAFSETKSMARYLRTCKLIS